MYIAAHFEMQDDNNEIYRYSILVGEAAFSLIPSKTIIVEQRQNSYFWGVVTENETVTHQYVNPITEENIRKVLQFILAMQFEHGALLSLRGQQEGGESGKKAIKWKLEDKKKKKKKKEEGEDEEQGVEQEEELEE